VKESHWSVSMHRTVSDPILSKAVVLADQTIDRRRDRSLQRNREGVAHFLFGTWQSRAQRKHFRSRYSHAVGPAAFTSALTPSS